MHFNKLKRNKVLNKRVFVVSFVFGSFIDGGLFRPRPFIVLYPIRGGFNPHVSFNWNLGLQRRKSAGFLLFLFLYFYRVSVYAFGALSNISGDRDF